MVSGEPQDLDQSQSGPPPLPSKEDGDSTERRTLATEIDVSFPVSVRGYDRGAVDAYVSRVHQLVAELEVTRSPEAAVKQALEQVGEQTKGVLERAGETAEQITVSARQAAEESIARARHEAADIVANAKASAAETVASSKAEAEATVADARKEAAEHLQRSREEVTALREEAEERMRALHTDTESIRHERGRLLEGIREIAMRFEEVATAADARFPAPQVAERTEEGNVPARPAGDVKATEDTATNTLGARAETRPRSPG